MPDMLDRIKIRQLLPGRLGDPDGYDQGVADSPTTLAEWLSENPPDSRRFTVTLAAVARRSAEAEGFRVAVREFLDEFAMRPDDRSRLQAVAEPPPLTGDRRYDAFLGALAEHLMASHGLRRPLWSLAPERFLDRFWFVSESPGFRAVSIAQAPAAFRRRGVFIPARSLGRV
jgi:hypothetical protein